MFLLQEFMILPVGAKSFKEAMKMGVEVYHNLKVIKDATFICFAFSLNLGCDYSFISSF